MGQPDPSRTTVAGQSAADHARAADALVRQHRPAVLALCLAHSRDIHAAEDRVQEVFIKALTQLERLRDPAKARPWLLQIARRVCVDHARRSPRCEPLGEAPAASPLGDSRMERLWTAIGRLPAHFRETITLYYLDGYSCAGVAAALGVSEVAVRQRLVRARLRLHQLLAQEEP